MEPFQTPGQEDPQRTALAKSEISPGTLRIFHCHCNQGYCSLTQLVCYVLFGLPCGAHDNYQGSAATAAQEWIPLRYLHGIYYTCNVFGTSLFVSKNRIGPEGVTTLTDSVMMFIRRRMPKDRMLLFPKGIFWTLLATHRICLAKCKFL